MNNRLSTYFETHGVLGYVFYHMLMTQLKIKMDSLKYILPSQQKCSVIGNILVSKNLRRTSIN